MKNDIVDEILKTEANKNLDEYGNIVTNRIIKIAITGSIICFLIAIIVTIFHNQISPLVNIEISIFREVFLGYGIFCLLVFIVVFSLSKKKPKFWVINAQEKKSLKRYNDICSIFDLTTFVAKTMVVLYIFLLLVVTPTGVSGVSMENTLHQDDKLLVYHFFYTPKRGDIIIVNAKNYEGEDGQLYVKRVIGLPGDKIVISGGILYVNGNIMNEDYIKEGMIPSRGYNITVPDECYFVMGDNRNVSMDSRSFGSVKKEDILGKAFLRLFPNPKVL